MADTLTWVLIVLAAGGYRGGPTAIPGYTSQKACMEAGAAFRAAPDTGILNQREFLCIPGPEAQQQPRM